MSEDDLKALGAAAAASSGAVALFHVVGCTPEAPDLETACGDLTPGLLLQLTAEDLREAARSLSSVADGAHLSAVSLGTPHFSIDQFARLMPLLDGAHPVVDIFVNCGRATLEEVRQRRLGKAAERCPSDVGCRHLRLCQRADAARRRGGHDQFRQVRLLRARQSRGRGHLRVARRMRRLGARWHGGAAMNARTFDAVTLVPGAASGSALKLDEPLSFWGGLNSATGTIIDRRHPQWGVSVVGRVLMMPGGRGSSSGSATLAEALRLGNGPTVILMLERDAIVVVGAMVAVELYGLACPVALADRRDWETLAAAASLVLEAGPNGAAISADLDLASKARAAGAKVRTAARSRLDGTGLPPRGPDAADDAAVRPGGGAAALRRPYGQRARAWASFPAAVGFRQSKPRQALDRPQEIAFFMVAERDRLSCIARSRGTADAMDVGLGDLRQLKIDDMAKPSMSMPRAAMSVATSARVSPPRKAASARSRWPWLLLP